MRILQVVTLISPEGTYGGPTTVALNQCTALQALGHEVDVAAGYPGTSPVVQSHGAVPLHLFPVRRVIPGIGFAGLASPSLLRWVAREIRAYDVVHVHVARDFVTLPVARLARLRGVPLVVQPHGMIDSSNRLLARPLDAFLTRPTLRRASAVCHLTPLERDELHRVARGDLRLVSLQNGVVQPAPLPQPQPPAHEVLFLARLHSRKRPAAFARAATALLGRHPQTTFALVGPDEGEGPAVSAAMAAAGSDRLRWDGPLAPDAALERLSRAAICVLPSVDEPFPMTVLEALARGVPVIITHSCGLAGAVKESGAGVVIGDDVDELIQAIDRVLSDHDLRAEMGARARNLASRVFAMEPVARRLESIYHDASGAGRSSCHSLDPAPGPVPKDPPGR
jgi:glycosyltransferase involved in cell wall biosynthesis